MTQMTGLQEGFEECEDKSIYFTLSLYISEKNVTAALGQRLTPDAVRDFQPGYRGSKRLRDAVEPLFNDIADRERLGAVDDFLLDTLCPRDGEFIEITAPDEIAWSTEGRRFIATPPGLGKARTIRVRRFWYTHANGAIGYHLSFRYNYDHTPGEFYFLSLLQKAAAPKEFEAASRAPGARPFRATDDKTGIAPLDLLRVKSPHGDNRSFWQYVRSAFNLDAESLFGALPSVDPKKGQRPEPVFENLVATAPFIEVPGLEMPVSRLLFFFEDATFFRRLLPEPDPATGLPPPRTLMVQEGCYLPYQEKLEGLNPRGLVDVPEVRMGADYWHWVIHRPDYDRFTDAEVAAARATRPALEDRTRQDCLQYLFIAGFNQNIIDFMNQDPSEILDSTDPIYPATEEQATERKFVRYANPRALITYVEKARSLEAANDYIGTCPYAFMIHVVSMHNEFMTREYEAAAFELIGEVERLGNKGRLKRAAEAFYAFRTGDYANYYRDRYMNVFRYDTESEVFEKMTQLRGIGRRNDYIERLISNMESQTRDREARLAKKDETAMNLLLGALGVFGFFQLAMMWADKLRDLSRNDAVTVSLGWMPPFLELSGGNLGQPWNGFSVFVLYASMGFTFALVVFLIWRLVRGFFR
ncbi:hypothetical protein K1X12_06800 [Hyphomonas sp. WL0036]|uniref:hypothetical protein n=1 Tax=Hyphomonas sediminis TaxID=2866160 RepID=UPI001C8090BB|nr:hypothetical protein [Hyphomonas sediminis]MBY9066601.1 hypothetical protein [Hyphomonas sediminis]